MSGSSPTTGTKMKNRVTSMVTRFFSISNWFSRFCNARKMSNPKWISDAESKIGIANANENAN